MNKIFNLIKIKSENGDKKKVLRFFNKPFLKFYKLKDKKYTITYIKRKTKNYDEVFYLKINDVKEYSLRCLQKWIDIANEFSGKVYIVCDNDKVKKQILKDIVFYDDDVEFIGTRIKKILPYVKAISDKFWYKAVWAKLAIFLHAKEHNYTNFWKIDADDTLFILPIERVKEFLQNAKNIAIKQEIKAFSLDMHTSKLYGKYWSFGVCYIDNTIDWFSIFKEKMSSSWKNDYRKNYYEPMNLDWFFTYLRDIGIVNIGTFYIDNVYFVHYGDRSSNFVTKIYHWENGQFIFPLLELCGLNNKENKNIYEKVIKIGEFNFNESRKTLIECFVPIDYFKHIEKIYNLNNNEKDCNRCDGKEIVDMTRPRGTN